jgi:hypothetical protein
MVPVGLRRSGSAVQQGAPCCADRIDYGDVDVVIVFGEDESAGLG